MTAQARGMVRFVRSSIDVDPERFEAAADLLRGLDTDFEPGDPRIWHQAEAARLAHEIATLASSMREHLDTLLIPDRPV